MSYETYRKQAEAKLAQAENLLSQPSAYRRDTDHLTAALAAAAVYAQLANAAARIGASQPTDVSAGDVGRQASDPAGQAPALRNGQAPVA